ncbi:uncharacterized protein LOC128954701 [Oppia nitens]|uniref:uncharacterized protein LOC128954701 n=1 Tax=Oppia nitens TaxID=1686743 RepID=UPI0023D99B5D|nr:uncharacterized protein LOC128954701 [Oppia nitens]
MRQQQRKYYKYLNNYYNINNYRQYLRNGYLINKDDDDDNTDTDNNVIDIDKLIDKWMKSFVRINVMGIDFRDSYRGSGCIVDIVDGGLSAKLITNYHVVEGLIVTNVYGQDWSTSGRVVYVDQKLDLALIEFRDINIIDDMVVKFDITKSVPVFGDQMLSLGYPTPIYSLCTDIVVCPESTYLSDHNLSYFDSCVPGMVYIEHCLPIYPGFSGGPLIDVLTGQLCGLNCIVENGYQRFAISIGYLEKFLVSADKFKETNRLRRLTEHREIKLGFQFKWRADGCYITIKFIHNKCNSELEEDDVITKINGQTIKSFDHFVDELNNCADNQPINITYTSIFMRKKRFNTTITKLPTNITLV